MSKRLDRWREFSKRVETHIEEYTVPQYGDWPDDQMSGFTVEEFAMNMKRYVNRLGRDSRGAENTLVDCMKQAHYSCELWFKLGEK